jgi:diamine N-acetyltransferase
MNRQELVNNPLSIQKTLILPSGEHITFRPLLSSDSEIFGKFLEWLSEDTNKRFQPHPLTMQSARDICGKLDYQQSLPLIALNDHNEITAYFILEFAFPDNVKRYQTYGILISKEDDCRLAPVVADEYQNTGVGSIVMKQTLIVAALLDIHHIVLHGGTQATNTQAIHFYEKFGFKKVGEFEENNMTNFDMVTSLN